MLSIAVCDDEILECSALAKTIKSICETLNTEVSVKQFYRAKDITVSHDNFDLIFLDILMPETNGMEAAKQIRKNKTKSKIVFVTVTKDYVFEAYDVEAYHYLIKPVKQDKLKNIITRAVSDMQTDENQEYLILSTGKSKRKILLKDILYIESYGRTVVFHCGKEEITDYCKIGELEHKLSDKHFFRIHKSFIVNLEHTETYTRKEAVLDNGDTLPIAKRRHEAFTKAIMQYIKRRGNIIC